jgi:hypothetical protein
MEGLIAKEASRMMQEGDTETALDLAVRRLERATALLDSRLDAVVSNAKAGGAFDQDRAKLAEALDAAHGRERELKAAGEEAARALDRAIAEIRSVMGHDAAAEF